MRPRKGEEVSTGGRYEGRWNKTNVEWKRFIEAGRVNFHPENKLFFMSQKILEWYYEEEMGVIIIHGQQGYGKSCYAGISCAEVYGHNVDDNTFYYDWDAAKKNIVFTPRQFHDLCKKKKEMDRMVWWDDAGYHLNALDYNDRLVKRIGKFFEVGRSKFSAIVLTCSDLRQVLSKIRDIPHVNTVKIIKAATPSRDNPQYVYQKDRRLAKIHKSWVSEDLKKSGKEREYFDVFYAHLPGIYDPKNKIREGFYGWYKPFRDGFCDIVLDEIDRELLAIGQ